MEINISKDLNYDIQKEKTYNYCGEMKNISQKEIMNFLKELGNNTKEINDKIFRYIIKNIKNIVLKNNCRKFNLKIYSNYNINEFKLFIDISNKKIDN